MLGLPAEVDRVLNQFLCCEVATVGRDGTPLTWPAVPLYLPERGKILLTTTIGFPVKALNVEREPRVSLLYSDPTGSDLLDAPAVLIQGSAVVADGVRTWGTDLAAHWQRVNAVQPASRQFSRTPAVRWFMDWYYMRLLIYVTPVRLVWWPHHDTTVAPTQERLAGVD